MTMILLVRHGENDWVKKNRLAGWIPGVHLNEKGHQQAQAAAERLAHLPIKAVYSSPLTRCLETAEYLARPHQLEIVPLEDVGEVRYGQWEGKKIKKLAKNPLWRTVQFFPSRLRFPDGEALREVQFRGIQALEKLCGQHEKDVIVVTSHADLIKLVLAHYLGVHLDLFQRIAVAPASVSILNLPANGLAQVLRLNDSGPIEAPVEKEKGSRGAEEQRSGGGEEIEGREESGGVEGIGESEE
jgi:probable phosphoglycerate mutase